VFFRMLTGKLPFEATTVQETMIKRLTDEPIKLAAARPDLSFPPGLQPVLDTALARTPAERYLSVAKFAADVAAVTGRSATSSVPRTRGGTDTESKTQLLDPSTAMPTTRISAQVRQPPARKRSLIAVAILLVVIVGAGGAWMALKGNGTNTNIASDTARLGGRIDTTSHATRPRPVTPPPAAPQAPSVDLAQVRTALDDLFLEKLGPGTASMVRDSAMKFYTAEGIAQKDKAYAAFVVGNAYFESRDRATGCQYVRTATRLDPGDGTYSKLLEQCN
jgi:hypothetical protein